MAQQINLCSPILLTQKRYFSAQTMAVALSVFIILGGALTAVWVWKVRSSSEQYIGVTDAQAREITVLQAAIQRNRAAAAPLEAALSQQLQTRKDKLAERQALEQALKDGLNQPGMAHSDRLQLLARSIPAQIWISAASATSTNFEITGFTLEPSALNDWVRSLAGSPLFQGLTLSDVDVEKVESASAGVASKPSVGESKQQVWSFHLMHARSMSVAGDTARQPSITGVKR